MPRDQDQKLMAEQMRAYCALGMSAEVREIVNRLLHGGIVSRDIFAEAVVTLLAHADGLDRWTPEVEGAYRGMSKLNQGRARSTMLMYYHAAGNHNKALQFIPARFSRTVAPPELAAALETFVALGLEKRAEAHAAACFARLSIVEQAPGIELLRWSLADYLGQKKLWEPAIELWASLTDEEFAAEATLKVANARLFQFTEAIEQGLKLVAQLRQRDSGADLELPGNSRVTCDRVENDLRVLRAKADNLFHST